ncbi:MAG: hypothetical protein KC431_31175, partial [Myxococcales bacterium]|nr:hypothetical protein [Myxococcales bacterium]
MGLGKRLYDVARSNLTDFASAFTGDEDARERRRLDKEVDEEIQREVAGSVGARAGRQARRVRDKAEEAWERAYEEAQARGTTGAPSGRGPSQRDLEGWYRTLELPVGSDVASVRKSYRR